MLLNITFKYELLLFTHSVISSTVMILQMLSAHLHGLNADLDTHKQAVSSKHMDI